MLVSASGPKRIRVVTHLDVPANLVGEAAELLVRAAREAIAQKDARA